MLSGSRAIGVLEGFSTFILVCLGSLRRSCCGGSSRVDGELGELSVYVPRRGRGTKVRRELARDNQTQK